MAGPQGRIPALGVIAACLRQSAMDRWTERVAVVTGASDGIGKAIALRLASEGVKVAALARRSQLLQEMENEVKKSGGKGCLKGYVCDVTSTSDVSAVFRSIESDLGAISILINNAGVLKMIDNTNIDIQELQAMIDTNIVGVARCLNAALSSMKSNNITDGHIINVSSITGHQVPDYDPAAAYSATKHALNALTKGIRNQLKRENSFIKVSLICPGLVMTEMTRQYVTSDMHSLVPNDIADAVIYSLSTSKHALISDMIIEPV